MLFIVATPIGNLEDITLRAIKILRCVDIVVCEDTRRTSILLRNLELRNPNLESSSNDFNIQNSKFKLRQQLISIHEHSSDEKIKWLIGEIKNGKSVALCTDAGTPGIADPGGKVVEQALGAGIEVVPIPGPSSLSAILSITGWLNEPVLFLGYLPKKKGRQTLLNQVLSITNYELSIKDIKIHNTKYLIPNTIVLLESPYRINKTIKELAQYLGEDKKVVIGRELTKQFEEIHRGTLGEMVKKEHKPKGEYIIAIKMSNG